MQYGNYLNNEYRVDLEIDDHELNHDTIRDIVVRDGWLVYEDKVARGGFTCWYQRCGAGVAEIGGGFYGRRQARH